jgi:glycosyltransferase involved in cell wall biosynthesis
VRVLAPTRYPWRFNSPRQSRHQIVNRRFAPFNYLSPKLEGVTVFPPHMPGQFDLVHAFNRIPIGTLPFIIGFESHLPRGFGIEKSRFFSMMTGMLAGRRCRGIVAISEFARRNFLLQHAADPRLEALSAKLQVHYPSMEMPAYDPQAVPAATPLRLVFVGNHFARKGGCVSLRIAEMAHLAGLPIELDVVSSMEMGAMSWTDPTRPAYFERYTRLLTLPNVRHHGALANAEVLKLMKAAHFSMLPTFGDTFGYTAIESMANGTPVVGTAQGALPEFIDGSNGILLDLPTGPNGEWIHLGRGDRGSSAFETAHAEAVEALAEEGFRHLQRFVTDAEGYLALRHAARDKAEAMFSAAHSDPFWDALYVSALATPASSRPPQHPHHPSPRHA